MMKIRRYLALALFIPFFALAACSSEPASEISSEKSSETPSSEMSSDVPSSEMPSSEAISSEVLSSSEAPASSEVLSSSEVLPSSEAPASSEVPVSSEVLSISEEPSSIHQHNFVIWEHNETQHWKKCDGCDEITTKEAHNYGNWIIDQDATEDTTGLKHHVCNDCGYKEEEIIPVKEHVHDFGEPTYTWKNDHNQCYAKRVCKKNPNHVETEYGRVSYETVTPNTCTTDGQGKYTAVFANPAFKTQYEYIVLKAPGHTWNAPVYIWNDDHTECTAQRICRNDNHHVESETVQSVYEVVLPATCEADGQAQRVATFTNPAFQTQTKTYKLSKLGHNYGEPTYEWNDDFTECIAYRTCQNNPQHVERESAYVQADMVLEPTCTTDGQGTITATFLNEAFQTQIIDNVVLPAFGHKYGEPTYLWNDDNTECTATKVCVHDDTHIVSETKTATYQVITPATASMDGLAVYRVEFEDEAFLDQEKEIVLPAEGSISDLKFTLIDDDTYEVSALTTSIEGDILIPAKYQGKDVTSIADVGFYNCSKMTSLSIPSSIEYIGTNAFYNCTNLTYNTYKGMSYLGNYKNPYLVLVKSNNAYQTNGFHENCEMIAPNAFASSTQQLNIKLPETIRFIGEKAFYNASKLYGISIPGSVKTIHVNAFNNCTNLSTLVLNEGTEIIDSGAFNYCKLTSLELPSTMKEIGGNAFASNSWLQNVTLNEGLLTINSYAFSGDTHLSIIKFPDSLTYIGDCAFYNCTELNPRSFGKNLTSICNHAFYNSGLKSFTFSDKLVMIGDNAFEGCANLTDSYFMISNEDDFVKITGKEFLMGNVHLLNSEGEEMTSFTMSNDVTDVPSYCFKNCLNLTTINLSSNLTSCDLTAFNGCKALEFNKFDNAFYIGNEEVPYIFLYKTDGLKFSYCDIAETCRFINSNAFSDRTNLQIIEIPDSVLYIGYSAFENCKSVTTITIGNGVKYIGRNAFKSIILVKNLVIPSSVEYIGNGAVSSMIALESLTIPFVGNTGDDDPHTNNSKFGIIFNGANDSYTSYMDETRQPNYNSSSGTSFYFPRTLKTVTVTGGRVIGYGAFYGCQRITDLSIPDTVEVIDTYAFNSTGFKKNTYGTSSSKYVGNENNPYIVLLQGASGEIAPTCKIIMAYAYQYVSAGDIVIPDSVVTLGEYAFDQSPVTSVTFGDGIETINCYTFNGATNLVSVTLPTHLKSIEKYAFVGCTKLSGIVIPDEVVEIGTYAFSNCKGMTSLVIGDGVTIINDRAFENCSGIVNATFGTSITKIGEYAFYECNSIKEVILPNTLTSLGKYAFYYCKAMETLDLGDTSLTNIAEKAFSYCKALVNLTLPETLEKVGVEAFAYDSALETIILPKNVDTLSNTCFYATGVKNLVLEGDKIKTFYKNNFGYGKFEELTIPEGVNVIGNYAFQYCQQLTTLNLPSTITAMYADAFGNCKALTTINFAGTVAQWKKITLNSWKTNVPATYVTCSNGTVAI